MVGNPVPHLAAIPDETNNISALTESFMDARYSPREVTPDRADQTHTIWERLASVLRIRGREGKILSGTAYFALY